MIAKRIINSKNSIRPWMYRILLFYTFPLFCGSLAYGQNLIPNPGFEEPFTQFEYQWVQPQGPFYHYEMPKPGSTFIPHGGHYNNGLCMYSHEPNEYLNVKLLEPLKANTKYRIVVNARLMEGKQFGAYGQKYIGVYFGDKMMNTHIPGDMYLDPQVNLELPESNRLKWFMLTDTFEVSGGEQFLTLGYFANTRTLEEREQIANAESMAEDRKQAVSRVSEEDKAWLYLSPDEQKAYLKENKKKLKKAKKLKEKLRRAEAKGGVAEDDSLRIAAAKAYAEGAHFKESFFRSRYYFDDFCLVEILPDSAETCEPAEISEKIEAGATIQLRNVFFKSGEAVLYPESDFQLEGLLQMMENYPSMKIEIRGYTDNVGSDKSNLLLSDDRAFAVENWLIEKGVEPERLSSEGFGASEFVDTNETEAGRANNRRVTFYIISM